MQLTTLTSILLTGTIEALVRGDLAGYSIAVFVRARKSTQCTTGTSRHEWSLNEVGMHAGHTEG